MKIRIIGSIVHPIEKPKQYFGMLDIYTDQPPLFIPFNFTVIDNEELYPHVLFFHEDGQLFLDSDGKAAPEDMELGPDQLGMYQIMTSAVIFGIFNILSRGSHGFNYTLLVPRKSKRRSKKPKPAENIMVPFVFGVINLDERQTQAVLNLGIKLYHNED